MTWSGSIAIPEDSTVTLVYINNQTRLQQFLITITLFQLLLQRATATGTLERLILLHKPGVQLQKFQLLKLICF